MALLLALATTLSYADTTSRIIITKTKKQSTLSRIKSKLDGLNVKMYLKREGKYSIVYSEEYSNQERAKRVLLRLKHEFPYARVVATQKEQKEPHKDEREVDNFFISLSAGVMQLSSSESLKSSGMSYTTEFGYFYTSTIFSTFAYSNTSTEDMRVDNIYSSLNYNFDLTQDFAIYSGVVLGYSSLELLNFAQTTPSTAIIYGLQVGSSYKLSNSFSLFLQYKGIAMNHTIELSDSNLNIDFLHDVELGVAYRF